MKSKSLMLGVAFGLTGATLSLQAAPPQSPAWVVLMTIITLLFSYALMAIFGVPIFLLFRRYRLTSLSVAIAAGFVCGAIGSVGFLLLIGLLLDGSISVAVASFVENFERRGATDFVLVVLSGLLGATVGLVFWFIARPDRTARA